MRPIFVTLGIILLFVAPASVAETTNQPGSVVMQFLELLQKKRDYDRAADHIHWEETYRRISREQQMLFALLQIGSSAKLREVVLLGIKDPKNFVTTIGAELTSQLSFLAHSNTILTAQLEPLVEPYLNEVVRLKKRIEQITFGSPQTTLNSSSGGSSSAVTRLEALERGRRVIVSIPLRKSREKWLIIPLDIVIHDYIPAIKPNKSLSTAPFAPKAPPSIGNPTN